MSRKPMMWTIGLLVIASMLLSACAPAAATPAPAAQPTATTAAAQPEPAATEPPAAEPTATVAAAVEPTATEAAAPAADAVLRVNTGSYPDIIDPQKSSFVNEIAHLKLMYEGLTRLNEKLETVPGAAEKWEYNADASEITFTILKDLKYSDGSVLNAKRFEYALLRNIDPTTAGEYAQITDDIKGAAEFRGADPAKDDLKALKAGVEVHALDASGAACTGYDQVDCLTLKIGLKQPAPYFHTVMSLWVTFPAKEENITKGGDTWWNDAAFQIGNGPFILDTLEPNTRALFVPNPNYWRGAPKYSIEYRYINDGAVAFAAYKNGEFDVVPAAAEDLAVIQNDPELSKEYVVYPGSCTFAVMFHQQKPPFDDQKAREAFALAIDRDAWVADVLKGLGSPTLTWIPQGFPGYDPNESRWAFDAEAAKKALSESKYANNMPEIKLTFSDTPRNRTRWEWLANQWKTVLGVDAVLDPVESTAFTALTKDVKTAPQAFILGWCADYPDPQNWLSVYWKTGAFGERIAYSNPDLDALLTKADSETDPTARMKLYDEAQKMLIDTAPVAFVWNSVNSYMVKPYVKGFNVTPQDGTFPGDTDPTTITIEAH